jgi:hypothetical protein
MNARPSLEVLTSLGVVATAAVLLFVALPRPLDPAGGQLATPMHAESAPPTAAASATHSAVMPSSAPVASAPGPQPTAIAVTNPDGPEVVEPFDEVGFIEPARALSTFAGLWVDRNQRDFHIAVAGDVDGAIDALKSLIPRDVTVYFHLVAHTYAELEAVVERVFADREELLAAGISVNFGSVSERENVIELGIDPLTDQSIATMAALYGQGIQFEYSPTGPPPFVGPWPTVPEVLHAVYKQDGGEEFLTCGDQPFPASALEAPGGAEDETGPVYDGLRETLRVFGPEFGGVDRLTWRLVYQSATRANFMAEQGDLWLEANTELEDGTWYAAGMGQCRPIVAAPDGLGPAEWQMDPDYPAPTANSTEISVLVWERACSGGRPSSGRMSDPVVEYSDDTLVITIGVRPIAGGATCPGPPGTPVTVVLPEPLGNRTLLDGMYSPPQPPGDRY